MHFRSWSGGRGGLFLFSVFGFEFYCVCLSSLWCLTCLLSLQDVQWAMELVVVRASWPGHPGK